LVLGRGWRGDDRGVDNRPLPHQQPAFFKRRPDLIEQHLRQIVPFQPVAEIHHGRRVRNCHRRQINAGKSAQRLTVVQRVFQRFVSQPVPLLQKVEPQHAFQSNRRPTALAFRVEGLQPRHQPRPRNNLLHLAEKLVPSRLLLLAGVLRLRKACLPLHCTTQNPPSARFYSQQTPKSRLFRCFLSALARAINSSGSEISAGVILFITSAAVYPSIRSAPTLKIWMTPFASVAILEKLALLRSRFARRPP